MSLLVTILGVSLLIVLHELGHFAVARACGMRVLRFSVGFGPVLAKFTRGDTTYQLSAIPLGGFVQVQGMGPEEADVGDGKSFRDKPVWQRALVIVAGPLANWLIAAVCVTVLAVSVGLRHYDDSQARLGELGPEGPAARAGLVPGDRVVAIDGAPVTDWASLVGAVRSHPGERVIFSIERAQQKLELPVDVERSEAGHGLIGVAPYAEFQRFGPGEGLLAGVQGAWRLTVQQVTMLTGMITGRVAGELSGIPGIVKMVSAEAQRGLSRLLEALSVLSIGLCLLNLLPIPALDGGRLVFLGIEAVRRRPLNPAVEGWVHAVGFVLLFALMIVVSVRDLL